MVVRATGRGVRTKYVSPEPLPVVVSKVVDFSESEAVELMRLGRHVGIS